MLTSPNAGPEDCYALTPSQQQVVELLSQGATVTAAAESVSIHRNTVSNWRRASPSFRAALSVALAEKALVRREQNEALVPAALETIRALLAHSTVSASPRLKAARVILDRAEPTPASKALVTLSPQSEALHNLHNAESSEPAHEPTQASKILVTLLPSPESLPNLHNSAQPQAKTDGTKPIPAVPPRSRHRTQRLLPGGCGRKCKRCCIDEATGSTGFAGRTTLAS